MMQMCTESDINQMVTLLSFKCENLSDRKLQYFPNNWLLFNLGQDVTGVFAYLSQF